VLPRKQANGLTTKIGDQAADLRCFNAVLI
jgi:hypothetical protein